MKTLYHVVLCPFSRQIRLMLAEKKQDVLLREEKPWQLSEVFLNTNPSGVLPTLETLQGGESEVVVGEYAIAEHLESTCPVPSLFGATPQDQHEVRRLVHWFNTRFYESVTVNITVEKIFKRCAGKGGPDSAALRLGKAAIHEHLAYISWLCNRRNWLAGSFLSMADLVAGAHFSAVDYLGDVPWEKHPVAKEWYARLKSRPSFRTLLAERVPGITPAPSYADLDF